MHPSGDLRDRNRFSILLITSYMLVVAVVLALVGGHVVLTMTSATNRIDDQRAVRAAQTALDGFKTRLSGTIRDNTVWDDAYLAVMSEQAEIWAYDNWAKTSEDYPLYDAEILSGAEKTLVSAYLKGKPFSPTAKFGPLFSVQVEAARKKGADPVISFVRTAEGLGVLASNAVQPYSNPLLPTPLKVLTFYKALSKDAIAELETAHDLPGLHFDEVREANELSVPVKDGAKAVIGYLSWSSKAPGTQVFSLVFPYVGGGCTVLMLFLLSIPFIGRFETRRVLSLKDAAEYEAEHDKHTGLLNRAGLLKKLWASGVNTRPTRICLLDIDGLKAINDRYGHQVGDEVLRQVAERISRSYPGSSISARAGGDAFVFATLDMLDASQINEIVGDCVRRPIKLDERTIELSVTLGVAVAHEAVSPDELFRSAEDALYEAKAFSRGSYIEYTAALEAQKRAEHEIEARLREALARGEIVPVFQPIVSSVTGMTVGVEALARWQNSPGRIGPDQFIPVAERAGLIDRLGMEILRQALEYGRRFQNLTVSVNVSPVQLCNVEFPQMICSLLEKESFPADRLVLEITEGVLISNPDQAQRAISILREKGVRFALDDFGSGFASIGTLRRFGFDRLKIDRSLVQAVTEGESGREVLRATVALARALNIAVTAEGVEDRAQADELRDCGCEHLQGYFFSMPVAAEEISASYKKLIAA